MYRFLLTACLVIVFAGPAAAQSRNRPADAELRDYIKAHPALKAPAEYVEARPAAVGNPAAKQHVFRAEAKVKGKAVPATIKVMVAPGGDGWGVEQLVVE